jgi:hypothetical protein
MTGSDGLLVKHRKIGAFQLPHIQRTHPSRDMKHLAIWPPIVAKGKKRLSCGRKNMSACELSAAISRNLRPISGNRELVWNHFLRELWLHRKMRAVIMFTKFTRLR